MRPAAAGRQPTTYTWTADQDQLLRDYYAANPRRAARSVATVLGWPFHVVKNRIKALALDRDATEAAAAPEQTDSPSTHQTPSRARRRNKRATDTPASPPPPDEQQVTGDVAEAPAARLRHAICPNRPHCYTRAQFDPTDPPEQLREQGFIYGLDPATQMPICANCRTTMVAAEPVDAPEAIRQAIAAGDSHQPRLWPDPPFNSDGALRELFEKRRETRLLKEAAEAAQRAAKKAQKAYAKSLVEKDAMEEAFEERMIRQEREAQRRRDRAEETLEDVARAASACTFERNTGQPCPVCRAASPSLVAAALQSTNGALTDLASEAHRALALNANSRAIDIAEKLRDAGLVVDALTARGLLGIPEDVVATWTEDERRQALAWVDGGLSLEEIPDVLGQPHRAAAAGADEQHCAACGARILRLNAGDGDVQPYPEGALVGMHCTGVETAAPAAEDAPATAAAEV
ncbi:MAG TPA: hypothetical protein VM364_00750 [Vicinamibacterales bacterium]|nr:hypothetical protein [Vicinamibacterales bacterium]